ncbi:oligosaccharide flippase family protein [bacterium]|nr:oligosaccharide flippase family protein [bacterium]
MLEGIKKILQKSFNKDNLEFIKHSKNYVSGELIKKFAAFLVLPIFTRLINPAQYGLLSLFNTLLGLITVIIFFNIQGAFSRYWYEKADDYNDFVLSNLIFATFLFAVFSPFLIIFSKEISSFIGLPAGNNIVIFAVCGAAAGFPFIVFLKYLNTSKQSKKYTFINVVESVSLLLISVLLVYLLKEERYLGRIYSIIGITGGFSLYSLFRLLGMKGRFKFKHIKYALLFGVPLVPHALSGYVLGYFDRIIIQQLTSSTQTGLYSFAYNVGLIMNMIVIGLNKAWVPQFYGFLRDERRKAIVGVVRNYSRIIYFFAGSLILFSKELVFILAGKQYHSSAPLVPVIVLGYVSYFIYTIYANYAFARKKTLLISISTIIAATANIILNYTFIPIYGYEAAAYTTWASWTLLIFLHYFNVRVILREEVISPWIVLARYPLLISAALFYYLQERFIGGLPGFLFKVLFYGIFTWMMFRGKYGNHKQSG